MDRDKKESNISPEEYLELFEKAMTKLAHAVDKEMGEERYYIYFEQLHKYQIEEIQAAVDQAIHDEEFNVIPPVGKLIKYIEEGREERRLRFRPLQIEHQEPWPEISPEIREKFIKPLMEKLGIEPSKTEEGRRSLWAKRREELDGQKEILKVQEANVDLATKKLSGSRSPGKTAPKESTPAIPEKS